MNFLPSCDFITNDDFSALSTTEDVREAINKRTLGLFPLRDIEYETLIVQQEKMFRSKKTPLVLIKEACEHHWSTYEGRRDAAMKMTGYSRKVPIPISLQEKLFAFPTHSPMDMDCSWIFFSHIARISPCPETKGTIVVFKNGHKVRIEVSTYIMKKQLERAIGVRFFSLNRMITY